LSSELVESSKRTDIVLGSTEPTNYTGSYTSVRKEIVDIEIAMYGSLGTILTTVMQMLSSPKVTVSEEQEEEGGLRTQLCLFD
jgi:hypothetical protein